MPLRIKFFFIFLCISLISVVIIAASLSSHLGQGLFHEFFSAPILLTIFATVVFIVLGSLLFSTTLTAPIIELHHTVQEIGSGQASARSFVNRSDELGELALAVNTMADELQSNKDRLESELARSHAFLESVGDGLVIMDKYGNIEFINERAVQMLRLDGKEVLGKSYHLVIPLENEAGERIPLEQRPLGKVFAGKKVSISSDDSTYYYVRSDNTRFPVAFTKTPVIIDGEVAGAIDVSRDITSSKELDRSKSEFVSLASHQLRTPLSIISMYAEFLKMYDGPNDMKEKEYRQAVNEIYEGSRRMARLIKDLLNVSRIEAKSIEVGINPVNIRKVIDDTLKGLRLEADDGRVNLVVHCADKVEIETDINLLYIILQNLVSNAVKYTPKKGTVTVSAKLEARGLLIEIVDTGYGIPKNQQANIFEKFFRADNIKKIDAGGTGLGLYIVKSFVDNLGGTTFFVSDEDRGTIFSVRLPLEHPKRERRKLLTTGL